MSKTPHALGDDLASLNEHELRRLVVEMRTRQKLGLVWESNAIERDRSLNNDVVLPRLNAELSVRAQGRPQGAPYDNLIIEGDNFDALRLLRTTHANKIRVILIDPPYNTGNDWIYNDRFVGENTRWRHSTWLEFLYQRLILARDLLTPDGAILLCIDDENRARLELLMDEVMPGGRKGSFTWRVRSGGNDTKGTLLSVNHEHVLVYGNDGFSFRGDSRDEAAYSNPDLDSRGDWSSGDLVKTHNATERPEAYYSIQNPETRVWYVCDPDSVWRFSSTTRPLKKKLQAAPMETLIAEKRILWPANEETVVYSCVRELKDAITLGTAPKQMAIYKRLTALKKRATTDAKAARLLSYIEPLEHWVGRTIGYGKPRYKRFRSDLKRDVTPLSSWLHPAAEGQADQGEDEEVMITVGATGEGTALYKKILDNKDFPYPKPLSLIMGLLDQATRKNDLILDFFAGSGTTAQAVLTLNEADGGSRRFIMVSSTEASRAAPTKNICRDVCAARIRKVLEGYQDMSGLPGDFGYITLDKLDPADARLDANHEQALQLLALRETLCALPVEKKPVMVVSASKDLAVVYLPQVNEPAIKALLAIEQPRLAVYSSRPQTVAERLSRSNKTGNSYAIGDVIMAGQARNSAGVAA